MEMRILVADDEPSILEVVKLYLEQEGFTVYVAADGDQALAIETELQPDLLNRLAPKNWSPVSKRFCGAAVLTAAANYSFLD